MQQTGMSVSSQIDKLKTALASISDIKGKLSISIDNCNLTLKTVNLV